MVELYLIDLGWISRMPFPKPAVLLLPARSNAVQAKEQGRLIALLTRSEFLLEGVVHIHKLIRYAFTTGHWTIWNNGSNGPELTSFILLNCRESDKASLVEEGSKQTLALVQITHGPTAAMRNFAL
jgi:hypothetical protein